MGTETNDLSLSKVVALVAALEQRLTHLEANLADMQARLAESQPPPGRSAVRASTPLRRTQSADWDWSHLHGDDLRRAWEDLGAWFSAQAREHAVEDKVPRHWYRHAGLVAHLAAMRSWYAYAHTADALPTEAVRWHDEFLRMVEMVWPRYDAHISPDQDSRAAERRARRLSDAELEFKRHVDDQTRT